MENLQSGIIPIGLFVFGILAKFILEIYIPKSNEKKNLKKNVINLSMAFIVALMTANIVHATVTTSWTQDFYVNVLFQVFLISLFLAFLVVANALIDLIANFKGRSAEEKESLKEFETA